MSDFLLASRPREPGALRRILQRWLGPVSASVDEYAGAWGTLAIARAPHDPEPVMRDEGGITVLIGEPFLTVPLLPAGPAVDDERRAALHRLLLESEVASWDGRLDGPFAALSIHPTRGTGSIVTDLFAWVTVFAAEPCGAGEPLVLGTHVDAVAEAAGVLGDVDPVSAVELIGYQTIAYPRTLYPAVRQAQPGSVRRFGADGWAGEARAYWRPAERTAFASPEEAAEALRAALVDDVRRAVDGHSRVGMQLSGGEDARAVLGAIPDGVRVDGFVFGEADNREIRSARRVARAYGASLTFAPRPPGHDLAHFEAVASMVGSQNEFVDVHGYGFHASLGMGAYPVMLGGYSSDALLKGDNVRRWARRKLQRGEAPGIRPARPPALPGVREELLAEAGARRTAFREWLAEIRPESADEWSFIYPFSVRRYATVFQGNRRLFRSHEPFMSNAVVQLAASVPQAWKLDRALFYRAMRPLLARSWYVPHTRNRMPYFPQPVNAVARPLLGVARGARALLTGTWNAGQESWPDWDDLVRTPPMHEKTAAHPIADSPLRTVFAGDPADATHAVAGWPGLSQLAALQLAYLTRG
ncbi:asparagine synthase-related protein [Longimicrobium sp.]|uniref:asparagine synthase-related protein n=1 Tax=Longimicrobium sp. TaxID=2029185 RepID=UPI003B3AE6F8